MARSENMSNAARRETHFDLFHFLLLLLKNGKTINSLSRRRMQNEIECDVHVPWFMTSVVWVILDIRNFTANVLYADAHGRPISIHKHRSHYVQSSPNCAHNRRDNCHIYHFRFLKIIFSHFDISIHVPFRHSIRPFALTTAISTARNFISTFWIVHTCIRRSSRIASRHICFTPHSLMPDAK